MANTERVNQQRPMNCRFDDILTFISVVEAGSVRRRGMLNVSKSVISKRISDLEAALRSSCFCDLRAMSNRPKLRGHATSGLSRSSGGSLK